MPDSAPTPLDFLHADDLCTLLLRDLEIAYQVCGPTMSREDAMQHFKKRGALIVVKKMLITEGERITRNLKS